jgi:hypothetical protein
MALTENDILKRLQAELGLPKSKSLENNVLFFSH